MAVFEVQIMPISKKTDNAKYLDTPIEFLLAFNQKKRHFSQHTGRFHEPQTHLRRIGKTSRHPVQGSCIVTLSSASFASDRGDCQSPFKCLDRFRNTHRYSGQNSGNQRGSRKAAFGKQCRLFAYEFVGYIAARSGPAEKSKDRSGS